MKKLLITAVMLLSVGQIVRGQNWSNRDPKVLIQPPHLMDDTPLHLRRQPQTESPAYTGLPQGIEGYSFKISDGIEYKRGLDKGKTIPQQNIQLQQG